MGERLLSSPRPTVGAWKLQGDANLESTCTRCREIDGTFCRIRRFSTGTSVGPLSGKSGMQSSPHHIQRSAARATAAPAVPSVRGLGSMRRVQGVWRVTRVFFRVAWPFTLCLWQCSLERWRVLSGNRAYWHAVCVVRQLAPIARDLVPICTGRGCVATFRSWHDRVLLGRRSKISSSIRMSVFVIWHACAASGRSTSLELSSPGVVLCSPPE